MVTVYFNTRSFISSPPVWVLSLSFFRDTLTYSNIEQFSAYIYVSGTNDMSL
jgi:hypothetical protein